MKQTQWVKNCIQNRQRERERERKKEKDCKGKVCRDEQKTERKWPWIVNKQKALTKVQIGMSEGIAKRTLDKNMKRAELSSKK